jgi:hypothetical protein
MQFGLTCNGDKAAFGRLFYWENVRFGCFSRPHLKGFVMIRLRASVFLGGEETDDHS